MTRGANQPVLGAAKNDETPGGRRVIEIGPWKTVLERQDQDIPERRKSRQQQEDRADRDEAPSPTRPASPDENGAVANQERDQGGRLQQEPQPFGQIEEHA